MGGSDKEEKLLALVPYTDLMLAIIFEDNKTVSIIYDMNVFQSEKKTANKKPSLVPLAAYKKIFGLERQKQVQKRPGAEKEKIAEPEDETENAETEQNVREENTERDQYVGETEKNAENANNVRVESNLNSGSSGSSQIATEDDNFKRPLSSCSIIPDFKKKLLTFKSESRTESFELDDDPDQKIVDEFTNKKTIVKWVPENPKHSLLDDEAAIAAKIEGQRLRTEFWSAHFRASFNIFTEIATSETPLPYYFVPLKKLLTPKQKSMLQRDWEHCTNDQSNRHDIFVLFDRSLDTGTHYTGIFQFCICINLKINSGLAVCTIMTGSLAHDGKAFRIVKKPNFVNTKTIKTMETFREHFVLHRGIGGKNPTRKQALFERVEKTEDSQHIVDKAALLVPAANLSYNFFEQRSVRDFIKEICNYRVKTSHQSLCTLLDKLGDTQGRFIRKRLEKITEDFKSVS